MEPLDGTGTNATRAYELLDTGIANADQGKLGRDKESIRPYQQEYC
jgi:hypothetical protein